MAMLAIDRTRNNQWQGNGEKYRGFYEVAVRESLPKDDASWKPIEMPVTLVCFPELKTAEEHVRAARKLFVDVERAHGQTRQLEVQWDQLQLEQSALATSSLIDAKARKGLSMRPAPPQRTVYLNVDPSTEKTAM